MTVSTSVIARADAIIEAGYMSWVRAYDKLNQRDRAVIRGEIARMVRPPTISLLLPIGFSPEDQLIDTLNSLREQLYPYWQIYLAGSPRSPSGLATYLSADPRIRMIDASNCLERGQAAASALRGVEDDYVAILDEGDRLPAHALYELAVELVRFPDTGLLYSDEDVIDFSGTRYRPRFKGGWDPDLLLSHDYIGGITIYHRAAIAEAGGVRADYDSAYKYDLTLRVTAKLTPDRICHVPSILLHRPAEAPHCLRDRVVGLEVRSGRSAVRDFIGSLADVETSPLSPGSNRIRWPIPSRPLVSVIMPTRDRADLIVPAAWGVLTRTDYPNLELIIVDNGTTDDLALVTLKDLRADRRVRILRHAGRFNFSAMNNAAVRAARGDVIVLLNNDIDVIHPDWLQELVSHAIRPDVGAVGAKLLYADGRLQHGGIVMAPGPNASHLHRLADRNDPGYCGALAVVRSCSAVSAACLAMRRSVYLEVGGLDEAGFAVAFNDVDLCLKLGEFGYRIVWTPFAELFHLESKSRGHADTDAKIKRERREIDLLARLWRHAFANDPYNNANLGSSWDDPLHLCEPRYHRPWQRAEV
jgi:GT2 family glycosyltransferase